MIDEAELTKLADLYGKPETREEDIDADEYLFESRSFRSESRRGEVVMVIERQPGNILVHSKSWYVPPVLRLPTGGIALQESVEQALERELAEETGYKLNSTTFIAFLRCHLHYYESILTFDSSIFHTIAPDQEPEPMKPGEDIHRFEWISFDDLKQIAAELRATPPPRRAWGDWRAVTHELAHELLVGK